MAVFTDSQLKRVTDELKKQDLWLGKITGTDKEFIEVATYSDIQRAVTKGVHKNVFASWETVNTSQGSYNIPWEIVGFDKHQKATTDGTSVTASLNLLMKYCQMDGMVFDAREALIGCPSGLTAGTYSFRISSAYDTYKAGIYELTIPVNIPTGGRIYFDSMSDSASTNGTIYDADARTSLGTAVATPVTSSSATFLGDQAATSPSNGCYLNHLQRCRYGSNNYKESNIAWWLGKKSGDGNSWTPRTMFDMPSSYNLVDSGMLDRVPQDFINIIGNTKVMCHTNDVYESPDSDTPKSTTYTMSQKFYLVSWKEISGSNPDGKADGSLQYDAYVNSTNATRIKKNSATGSAQWWWLRDPNAGFALNERIVYNDGSLNYYGAVNGYRVAPGCSVYPS